MKTPLMSGTPLDKWTAHNHLVLLGDAAHAMVPYMSQGAAMAVEDGAALAAVLSHVATRQELPFALRLFERERGRRSGMMQEASLVNAMLWHFADGPLQAARDEAMRPEVEGRAFWSSPNQWSDPVTQGWAYGYDAEAVMERVWEEAVRELIVKSS